MNLFIQEILIEHLLCTRDPSRTRDTTTNKAGNVAAHVILLANGADRKGPCEYTNQQQSQGVTSARKKSMR